MGIQDKESRKLTRSFSIFKSSNCLILKFNFVPFVFIFEPLCLKHFDKNISMKKSLFFALAVLSFALISCKKEVPTDISIIPQPNQLEVFPGKMMIDQSTRIVYDENEESKQVAEYLASAFANFGFHLEQNVFTKNESGKNSILLQINYSKNNLSNEGYQLTINEYSVKLTANTAAGLFYGVQSLLQLIPVDVFEGENQLTEFEIPCLEITDQPRFPYRGMHLDVCRHFFPVDFIKQYIDLLAMYKFNTFHWHLTEDQGWRIEIKKYPKLTEIAAYRDSTLIGHYGEKIPRYDGKKYGGFYTQEEIKDIVQYAAERHITIIPEIEMPGHSLAALSAYPELACTPGPFHAATTWGVFDDIYCTKEETFTFLENVLDEVMALFPSKYIHIGGDEAPKSRWENCPVCQANMKKYDLKNENELQSWFNHRIEEYLNENGRQLIGWDEILDGGLSPNATVMSWRGTEGGIAAAKQGHDAIMTPGGYCYFDHYQADPEFQPLAIGGLTTLKKVYSYEPVPEILNDDEAKHILGAQANLWTEYIATPEQAEYMVLPRMAALAEVDWCEPENKDWPDFQRRVNDHFQLYDALGLNYSHGSYKIDISSVPDGSSNTLVVSLESEIYNPDIRYTTDGSDPKPTSAKYTGSLTLAPGSTIKAAVFVDGKLMEKPVVYIADMQP